MNRLPRERRTRRPGAVVLAGWLFADLLLVLALVSLADQPDPLAARTHASRNPAASGSPSASPTPTGPRSVARVPEEFPVSGEDDAGLVTQIRKSTAKWSGRAAALVLTFGGGMGGSDYAHRVNGLLGRARPEMFTRQTATDDYHDLGARPSTAVVRVYFYTSPD